MNADKLENLKTGIRRLESVVVGFSGGVDSTLLARLCIDLLGKDNTWLAVGDSASVPAEQLRECRELAESFRLPQGHFTVIQTGELEDANYRANSENRCYFCKRELFGRLTVLAEKVGAEHVVDGFNASDMHDFRPGRKAGRELGVRSPLAENGFSKDDIRELAKTLGLPNWDKPAQPCLASRIPYHSPITEAKLRQVEAAERLLREAGFKQFRVRHHGVIARLEIDDFDLLFKNGLKDKIDAELKKIGFSYVTADLDGFRSGSLNINLKRED